MDSPTTFRTMRRTMKATLLPSINKKSLIQILKTDPEQFKLIIDFTVKRSDYLVASDFRRPTILFHIQNFDDLILAIDNPTCDGHILNITNSFGMNFLQYSMTTYYWWNAYKLIVLATNYKITRSLLNLSGGKTIKSPIELIKPMISDIDGYLEAYYQNIKFDLYKIGHDGSYPVLNLVTDPAYHPYLPKIIKYLDLTKLKNIKTTLLITERSTHHGRRLLVQKIHKDVTFHTLLNTLNPELYNKLFVPRLPDFNRDVQEYIMSRFDVTKKLKLIEFADKSEKKEECKICYSVGSIVVFNCGHCCCGSCCLTIIAGNRLCYNCRIEIKTTILLY